MVAASHLDRTAMAQVRAAALKMDGRAYRISKIHQVTPPAAQRH